MADGSERAVSHPARHAWRVRASLLAFLLLLTFGVPARAAAYVPAGYVLQGVPLVKQTYNACGPASIAEVLGYYGLNYAQADISRYTRANERAYMSAQAIVNFAPLVGMEARLYVNGSLSTVRTSIQLGVPVIALQSHITAEGRVIPHWRVIVGYDDQTNRVYLMDPLLGYVTISYNDFNRVWADHKGQFALMYPPGLGKTIKERIG